MTGSHEVRGSIPLSSTNKNNNSTGGVSSRFCFCDRPVTSGVLRRFRGGKIVKQVYGGSLVFPGQVNISSNAIEILFFSRELL